MRGKDKSGKRAPQGSGWCQLGWGFRPHPRIPEVSLLRRQMPESNSSDRRNYVFLGETVLVLELFILWQRMETCARAPVMEESCSAAAWSILRTRSRFPIPNILSTLLTLSTLFTCADCRVCRPSSKAEQISGSSPAHSRAGADFS